MSVDSPVPLAKSSSRSMIGVRTSTIPVALAQLARRLLEPLPPLDLAGKNVAGSADRRDHA